MVEVSKNRNQDDVSNNDKNALIGNLQNTLHMYLTMGNESLSKQDEAINDFLDGMKILKKIDVDTLDEKDKILLGLTNRLFDIVRDVQNIVQTTNIADKELLLEKYYDKEVDLERDWTYTVFDMLLVKQINVLENKLGLDMDDFVSMGAMVLSKYKDTKGNVDWQAQLTDFFDNPTRSSPLFVNLLKVKQNNQIPDDVFAQRLIENFDYLDALCEDKKNQYFIGYIGLIMLYLGCTQEQVSYIQKKYYGISV